MTDAFPDWSPAILEVRDLGERVLVHARGEGSGAGSGVGIQQDFWQALEFRHGLAIWYASFRTEAEALEAIGLRA